MATSVMTKSVTIATSVASVVCLSALVGTNPANAAILNGGFENGTFTNWETAGSTSVIGADPVGGGPGEGVYQAKLEGGAVNVPDLETFLGLSAGSLSSLGNGTATSGSAIKQIFAANAGDVVKFAYNFIGTDYLPYNDFSFFSINSSLMKLADIASLATPDGARAGGYKNFSYTILTSGTYTLGFGVTNVLDNVASPSLLIDSSATAVPTPALLPGLIGLGMGVVRKRKAEAAKQTSEV